MCTYDHTASLGHLLYLLVMAVAVPMSVTYAAYGKIACTIFRSKRRVAPHVARRTRRAHVLAVFVMSSSFTVFWVPYTIVSIVDNVGDIHDSFVRFAVWFGISNSSINCLVLSLGNTHYREVFRNILCCCAGGRLTRVGQATPISTVTG